MAGLWWNALHCLAAFLKARMKKEALENIKEAITAGLLAEDRKTVAALSNQQALSPLVVAV